MKHSFPPDSYLRGHNDKVGQYIYRCNVEKFLHDGESATIEDW